jgi:hypothetical protein
MYPLSYEAVMAFYLRRLPLSSSMIIHVAKKAAKAVPHISRSKENVHDANLPSIEKFVVSVITSSDVSVPVLIASLVYLSRLQTYLPSAATGCPSTSHRLFLVALILADKAHNNAAQKTHTGRNVMSIQACRDARCNGTLFLSGARDILTMPVNQQVQRTFIVKLSYFWRISLRH